MVALVGLTGCAYLAATRPLCSGVSIEHCCTDSMTQQEEKQHK